MTVEGENLMKATPAVVLKVSMTVVMRLAIWFGLVYAAYYSVYEDNLFDLAQEDYWALAEKKPLLIGLFVIVTFGVIYLSVNKILNKRYGFFRVAVLCSDDKIVVEAPGGGASGASSSSNDNHGWD